LVPNRIDRRTLEGRQLVEELEQFGEEVAPALTNRSAYVRCFAAGESVATLAFEEPADLEVRALADIVEVNLSHPVSKTKQVQDRSWVDADVSPLSRWNQPLKKIC
jgi:chromosome partitioning protein